MPGSYTQVISRKIRELLGVEEPYWNRSIALPYASELTIFFHQKSFTGRKSDQLQLHSTTWVSHTRPVPVPHQLGDRENQIFLTLF